MTTLAFYGILRDARFLDEYGQHGAECLIPGDLYSVHDSFPALVAGEGAVRGRMWTAYPGAEAEALKVLDGIEGYRPGDHAGSMYIRQPVRVIDLSTNAWATVSVYVWNRGTDDLDRVESGDWKAYTATMVNWFPFGARVRLDCTCTQASDNECPAHGNQPFWSPSHGWQAPNFWSVND